MYTILTRDCDSSFCRRHPHARLTPPPHQCPPLQLTMFVSHGFPIECKSAPPSHPLFMKHKRNMFPSTTPRSSLPKTIRPPPSSVLPFPHHHHHHLPNVILLLLLLLFIPHTLFAVRISPPPPPPPPPHPSPLDLLYWLAPQPHQSQYVPECNVQARYCCCCCRCCCCCCCCC
jgi:hypothetical protein